MWKQDHPHRHTTVTITFVFRGMIEYDEAAENTAVILSCLITLPDGKDTRFALNRGSTVVRFFSCWEYLAYCWKFDLGAFFLKHSTYHNRLFEPDYYRPNAKQPQSCFATEFAN